MELTLLGLGLFQNLGLQLTQFLTHLDPFFAYAIVAGLIAID
jgi:hypothetical protein